MFPYLQHEHIIPSFLECQVDQIAKKKEIFWIEVKEDKPRGVWAVQEHHLDTSSPKKQAIGRKLVFYGQSIGRDIVALMVVYRELELVAVFNHLSS